MDVFKSIKANKNLELLGLLKFHCRLNSMEYLFEHRSSDFFRWNLELNVWKIFSHCFLKIFSRLILPISILQKHCWNIHNSSCRIIEHLNEIIIRCWIIVHDYNTTSTTLLGMKTFSDKRTSSTISMKEFS